MSLDPPPKVRAGEVIVCSWGHQAGAMLNTIPLALSISTIDISMADGVLDTPGAGWGEARWSSPGIVVDHDGAHWFIDDCVRATVRAYAVAFPALFADADLGPVARELDRYAAFDAVPLTLPGTTP